MSLPFPQKRIRFGPFEVDARSGELLRQGTRVDLQDQPFQVLAFLLERPGEVVTREELSRRLWPDNTFVDFDRGLNKAVNKLRIALKDSAEKPRFIETLPQRGYRFVAPVEIAELREAETDERKQSAPAPPDSQPVAEDRSATMAARRWRILPWAIAVVFALIAALQYGRQSRVSTNRPDKPFLHFDLDLGSEDISQPTISADGRRMVFVSKGALVVRHLDQTRNIRVAGTEGGILPFFSPNGQWIGFFAGGKLQKVAFEGGVPIALCRAESPGGGSWADDDQIIAAVSGGGLSRVSAAGGVPQPLTDAKSDRAGALMHLWPQMLPGGRSVLFAAVNGSAYGSLRILTLGDGKVHTVVENATRGHYLPSGYLVYFRHSKLFAEPMDTNRWRSSGPAVPLLSDVSNAGGFGRGEFDVSNTGTLVYRAGTSGNNFVVSWLSSSGKTEPVLSKPDTFLTPRLSPDGKRLAVAMVEEDKQSLWIYDLERETWARLTPQADPELLPAWSPDGAFIAFRSGNTLAWTRSDGSGTVRRLASANVNVAPWSFSGDGKWLAFWPLQPDSDLWTLPVERATGAMELGKPQVLLQHAGSKGAPAISPDNRWVAYTSNESGYFEIYVMPFAPGRRNVTGKWLISSVGGTSPVWSRNGQELFYQGVDHRVWVAAYKVNGDSFLAQKPRVWSETLLGETGLFNAFDLPPDSSRVLALMAANEPGSNMLVHVVLNVDSELSRIAAAHH